MSKALAPSFDFCQFQRFVNNTGGTKEFPSYADYPEQFLGDRLTQYGFGFWSDMIPHVPKGSDEWSTHPKRPGVYAISVVPMDLDQWPAKQLGYERLLYIGSAKNIHNRLNSQGHWIKKINDRFTDRNKLVVVRVLLTDDYLWAEKSLIRTLRPLLNIQHNG